MTYASPQPAQTQASLETLQQLTKADLLAVNQVMLKEMNDEVPLIRDLASHIIAAGGKRLRPALVIASAVLFNYTGTRHQSLAACVEFIHTATLLHDDVVDESQLRRGEATANALFGNKASVLVGDYILSKAFQLMVRDGSLEVLRILSDAAAIISRGEVKQLMVSNNPEASEVDYFEVIGAKTAALFAAACEIGPVISNQQQYQVQLKSYGYDLGVAFQLIDDALDYAASQEKLGKTVGDDFREGKITLPIITAYAEADEKQKHFFNRTLGESDVRDGDLEEALAILTHYNAIERTIERARTYGKSALKAIAAVPDSMAKQALIETVEFCINREF